MTALNMGSYYNGYGVDTSSVSVGSLEQTLNTVGEQATEQELMSACKEFEAYFIEQLYKGMERTIMKADDEDSSSSYADYFSDMRIQQYAKLASENGNGIGLANQLYDQMKRNYGL